MNFFITTVVSSSLQPDVSIQLIAPTLDNSTLTAASGTPYPRAWLFRWSPRAEPYTGAPIPNVGVQVVDAGDPIYYSRGFLRGSNRCCAHRQYGNGDLRSGSHRRTGWIRASGVGGRRPVYPRIWPDSHSRRRIAVFHFRLPASLSAPRAEGQREYCHHYRDADGMQPAIRVLSAITSAASGSGNGSVSYTVEANSGAARSGTLTIAGQTYTVNQSAAGTTPSPLTISPQSLPDGTVATSYQIMLTATGGTPPYTWSPVGPISTSGLSFQANGNITGIPATAASYPFTATVTDIAGATKSQTYSITVNATSTGSSGFNITNTSFPNGAVGQAYSPQLLQALGGCVTPFSPQPSFTVNSGALPVGLSISGKLRRDTFDCGHARNGRSIHLHTVGHGPLRKDRHRQLHDYHHWNAIRRADAGQSGVAFIYGPGRSRQRSQQSDVRPSARIAAP